MSGSRVTVETDDGIIPSPSERRHRRETGRDDDDEDRSARPSGPRAVVEIADEDTMAALDGTARALGGRDEAERLRRERDQAAADAAKARNDLARANALRQQDRIAIVASAVETAQAEQQSALAAVRDAREAGDFEAEAKAMTDHSAAAFRYNQATAELSQLKAAAPQQGQGNGGQAGNLSPQAQQFLQKHPRFYTDEVYQGTMMGAHNAALRSGLAEGSDAYFDYIQATMDRTYGENAGGDQDRGRGGRDMGGGRGQGFGGAAPNRGGPGRSGSSASNVVNTPFGDLIVNKRSNGDLVIKIPPGKEDDWREAALINKMQLADYCAEQVQIAQEMANGGSGGLTRADDGRVYR